MPVYFTDGRKGMTLISKDYDGAYMMHYRTPGSKNGQRLYQYKDGSLTPLGYIHYGVKQRNPQSKEAKEYDKKSEKIDKLDRKIKNAEQKNKNTDRLVNKRQKLMDKLNLLSKEDISAKLSEFERKKNEAGKIGQENANKKIEHLDSLPDGPEKGKEIAKIIKESNAADKDKVDEFFALQKDGFSWSEAHMIKDAKSDIDPKYHELTTLENWVFNEIQTKSGDWYETEGVSKGFTKITDKIKKLRSEEDQIYDKIFEETHSEGYKKRNKMYSENSRVKVIKKQIEELHEQMPEQVLKDLNIPVTKENLEYIRPFVFWD